MEFAQVLIDPGAPSGPTDSHGKPGSVGRDPAGLHHSGAGRTWRGGGGGQKRGRGGASLHSSFTKS